MVIARQASGPTPSPGDALIVVDVQNDFLPEGALGVPRGDEVIAPLNEYIRRFRAAGSPIVATRDWHPADHCSFLEQGGPWPPHCIRGTRGACFADALSLPEEAVIVAKDGTQSEDAYSGFGGTDLHRQLQERDIERLFVGGLATDYCVLNTVRDALRLGYRTYLLLDAIRAVDVEVGDGDRAVAEMKGAGAILLTLEDLR